MQMICGSVGKKGNVSESCESVRVRSGNETAEFAKPSSHPAVLFLHLVGIRVLATSYNGGIVIELRGEIRRGNIENGVLRTEYHSGEL